jgi:uncharacterized protein (TIGR02444 family)
MKQQASKDGARMSDRSELSIWDFALAWYQVPGVEADCLVAQDIYGLDVTALIFALYRTHLGHGFDADVASELARTLSSRVVEPLRAARIALKAPPGGVDTGANEALRQKIKAAELDAERLTLDALMTLPVSGALMSYEGAVAAIADASQAISEPVLKALLKRLAIGAQNM